MEPNSEEDVHGDRTAAEILDGQPHSPEMLQNMRNHLEELKRLGIEAIND